MNNSSIINSALRFVFLLLVQVFLLKQISWGFGGKEYLFIILYPLFIMMLPLRMLRPLVVLSGFAIGLSVDLFYETLGINAAAATFSAFLRPAILHIVRPRDGYNIKANPTVENLGWNWFLKYAAWFFGAHLLILFTVQTFTPYLITDILLKTFFSFIISFLGATLVVLIFNPKS